MAKQEQPKMVRLRNINSGAVVQTTEDTAERLGAEWEPADAKKTAAKK